MSESISKIKPFPQIATRSDVSESDEGIISNQLSCNTNSYFKGKGECSGFHANEVDFTTVKTEKEEKGFKLLFL